jgi:hypothetical protein
MQHPAKVPEKYRRLAWNGISFAVPENWELALFRFLKRQGTRIEIEDEYSVRMEVEWVYREKGNLDFETIIKRYEKASKGLTVKADETTEINDLPKGWHATDFRFKETGKHIEKGKLEIIEHGLTTVFYCCPDNSLFCFFLLHFMPEDSENPEEITRNLAQSFENHTTKSVTPWQLFDISFALPQKFRLDHTQFDIGSKMMRFKWSGRRFHLWYFSCADIFLKDAVSPAHWAAGYLNGYAKIAGIRFRVDDVNEGVAWRRKKIFIFGHSNEIGRWCFKYSVGFRILEEENKMVLWVYNYRKDSDLDLLPEEYQQKNNPMGEKQEYRDPTLS